MGLTRISEVGRWTACEAWAMTGQEAKGGNSLWPVGWGQWLIKS